MTEISGEIATIRAELKTAKDNEATQAYKNNKTTLKNDLEGIKLLLEEPITSRKRLVSLIEQRNELRAKIAEPDASVKIEEKMNDKIHDKELMEKAVELLALSLNKDFITKSKEKDNDASFDKFFNYLMADSKKI